MIIFTRHASVGLLGLGLILGGCGKQQTAAPKDGGEGGLTKVILQTDWYAQPEHGGFYQALVKGYYREAGLDVEILQGGPNAMVTQKVATGVAHFGMGRSDEVAISNGRGIPVMMIAAFMQRDPQGIMFHRESGIKTFKDLDGRNLMALAGSAFIPIVERTYNIKLAITQLDYGLSRFLANKDLVQQCFVTNEPYYLRAQGVDPGVLLLSDTGFSPYRVFYARRDFIEKNPKIVEAFAAASIRGWADYISGDRAEANARIASLNPKMNPEFMDYSVTAMKNYRLVEGDASAGDAIGQIRRARVERELEQLRSIGQLDRPLTVDDVFAERFMPAAVSLPNSPQPGS